MIELPEVAHDPEQALDRQAGPGRRGFRLPAVVAQADDFKGAFSQHSIA